MLFFLPIDETFFNSSWKLFSFVLPLGNGFIFASVAFNVPSDKFIKAFNELVRVLCLPCGMFHGVTVEREEGERGKKNGRITEENLPRIKFLFPTYKVPFALLKSFGFVLLLSFFCDPEGKKKTPSAFVYSGRSVY